MIPLPPRGTEARDLYLDRMLNDTGFMCRAVLGMDTDRDATGVVESIEGKGGIRDHGPHQEMIELLDDVQQPYVQLTAPRNTYKSSAAEGWLTRLILKHENVSIMSAMGTKADAQERVQKVRDILTTNPIISELFPGIRGESMWRNDRFITGIRTDHTILSPTLYAASPQTGLAGGRPDFVLMDDIVTELTAQSELGRKKAINFVESAVTTQAQSTCYRHITTPWHAGDAFHYLMNKGGWVTWRDQDSGIKVIKRDDGTFDIEGTTDFPNGRWPNLPVERLRRIIKGGIRFETFMSQYMLRCVQGLEAQFKAVHFQPVNWSSSMTNLTGYMLCDTAPSGNSGGDLNVLMFIGVDARGHVYILDCEIGFWLMYEFCERYIEMLARWTGKVNYRGDVWERSNDFPSYDEHINIRARERGVRRHMLYAEPRNHTELMKKIRVQATSVRFQSRQVSVCSTVPRTWNSGTKILSLWEPEGDNDPVTKMPVPSGELVSQFVNHGYHPRDDIPDTFALVNAIDSKQKRRVCLFVPPPDQQLPSEVLRTAPEDVQYLGQGSSTRFFNKWSR